MSFLRQRIKSVETTEKSVVAKDLARCLKNREFFETTDQIFRVNRFCFSVQKLAELSDKKWSNFPYNVFGQLWAKSSVKSNCVGFGRNSAKIGGIGITV
jgi:hypothetical protein